MKAVYLAGPINGCSDEECMGWRARARQLLEGQFDIYDPMDRDFRGRESLDANEIVSTDLLAIAVCDILIVNASRPSWGTAMEVMRAWDSGKGVVAFSDAEAPSPWLTVHAHAIVKSLEAAVVFVMNFDVMARSRT
jgi:nucleoside 2-deoxyribosyltransferase